ncbi:hypothetical protein PO878_20930 [Iamia majanohamensis]|uniref:DUF1214 domain-containing protein n=1 Tax=Iamia majanohamensis TaxID=467976 RepID=A0AAE9YDS2_9ACTN|nr:DUF1214 domain-containing protein [Iamia majanohamensis]WCO66962.1 hypothetical protein PO878_20930 [Iamia majanohamensis]
MTESRDAFADLLATLQEVGDRFAGEEWGLTDPTDQAEGLRVVLHHLGIGIETQLEQDPAHPTFRAIVTPWRKALGDNADALYHDAPVSPAGTYRVRGRTGGAVYVSFTVEASAEEGAFPSGTVGVLNDTDFDVAADGSFEITVGGPPRGRGWLPLAEDASRLTVRHYWEDVEPPATPPAPDLALTIDLVDGDVPEGPAAPTDATVARSLRRMATYVRSRTLDTIPRPGEREPAPFVSQVPHEFPPPVPPGAHALAAADAAYSMAPYLLGPDQALVIRARWPECRCASVSLWTRQMQTFDYLRGRVSLNRAQAEVGPDGEVEVVIAHRDPGRPNWLTTEGRPFGIVFWRFMLPEGAVATPTAEVVDLPT